MPWQYDPNLSKVEWSVGYLGIATVKGLFKDVRAELNLEGDDPRQWSAAITIATASLDSGHPAMDDHVRSADFLDAGNCPTIQFTSKSVHVLSEEPGAGPENKPPGVTDWQPKSVQMRIHGDVTLRGVTRPLDLDARYSGQAADVRGRTRRAFSARTSLRRSDFNINTAPQVDPTKTVAGPVVSLAIEVIATRVE